jgi:hypothetical protein
MTWEDFVVGSRRRTTIPCVAGVTGVIILIVWLFFFASDYNIYQNLAVLLVLALVFSVVGRLLGGKWDWESNLDLSPGPEGLGWRAATSAVTAIGWLAFIIAWLAFFAGDFNIYENLAIFLLSILVMAGIMGLVWVPWAIREMH